MGKNKACLVFLGLLCGWYCTTCQPVLTNKKAERKDRLRHELVSLAESQLFVRELTGNNDGREVEKYLRSVNLKKGQPWCAAFVSWLHLEKNIPAPESGWSPDWFRTNVVHERNVPTMVKFTARPGAVFGLYYESKRRVAHVGLITGDFRFHYETIEGNTNTAGSNEGDGVYRKIRKKETVYIISDYVCFDEYIIN